MHSVVLSLFTLLQMGYIHCMHRLAVFYAIHAVTISRRTNLAYAPNVILGKTVHVLIVHDLHTAVHNLANPLTTAAQFAAIMI